MGGLAASARYWGLSNNGTASGDGKRHNPLDTSRFLTQDPAEMNHGVSVVPAGSLGKC